MSKQACLDSLVGWRNSVQRFHGQLEFEPRDESFHTHFNRSMVSLRGDVLALSREPVIAATFSNKAESSLYLSIPESILDLQGAVSEVCRVPTSVRAKQQMGNKFRALETRIQEVTSILYAAADSRLQNPYSCSTGSRMPCGTLLATDFTNLLMADKARSGFG